MVVEDDENIRELITDVLILQGYTVIALSNGHNVPVSVEREQPALILLDIMLGDVDGREVCLALKRRPETCQVPVIIVSASRTHLDAASRSCGADAYLPKPFDLDELLAQVKTLTTDDFGPKRDRH